MKRAIQSLLGIAVSALAVWLTFRGKDLGAIWRAVQAGDYRYLPVYLATLLVIHLLRTYRWGILLEPVAKVPFARLNAVSAVGFTALLVLPFRLGEFARPYLIADRPRLRVSAALSSVVVERVADGIFTAMLLLATLFAVPDGTPHLGEIRKAGYVMAALFAGMLAFLVLAYRSRELAVRIVTRLLGPLSPRLAVHAGGMLDAFTILGVLVAGVMIPAGPGMVGTFQLACAFGLSLFVPEAVAHTRGVAWANVLWASPVGFQLLLGAIFIFSPHVKAARIFASPEGTAEALDDEEAEALERERQASSSASGVPPAGA